MQQIRPAKYRVHEYGQIGKFKKLSNSLGYRHPVFEHWLVLTGEFKRHIQNFRNFVLFFASSNDFVAF